MSALELFSLSTRAWFEATFPAPTAVQERGWEAVAAGQHTLMCAPTGSGKTLAAFLWSIDRLLQEPEPPEAERCRVLYVSPLRALTVDVERNLRAPLRGIALSAERAGIAMPTLRVGVRTGDTAAADRRDMERHPPDLLITTPESLFLLLTSRARALLASVRWVIVDEIHSIAATKRGAHFALSLERLCALTGTEPQRIGLSATQRPLEETGRLLGGVGRAVTLVETGGGVDGHAKLYDISVEVPVTDMGDLERDADRRDLPAGAPRRSIWPAMHPRLLELVRTHRSTIIFANSRRMAERLAEQLNELAGEEVVRAHHGSIAREQRAVVEELLKTGRLPAIVATSSLELGIDMGAVDLVIQVEAPPSVASGIQRIGRAGHHVGEPSSGVVFPKFRGDLLECAERWPREVDEAHDLLRRLGDLSIEECAGRGVTRDWLGELEGARRVARLRIASEERWVATEDAGRYRDALGASLPLGLPEAFLEAVDAPLESLLRRYARTHVPFAAAAPAARFGLPVATVEATLERLVATGDLLVGEFRPGGAGREWCHPEVLRSLRRRSLAALRHEIEPVDPEVLARFLPAWHGIGSRARGLERLHEVVAQLQGVPLPASVLERGILDARMDGYSSALLDELVSLGEVVWVGRGALGRGDGRIALYLRADAPRLIQPAPEPLTDEIHERLRAELARRGASFFGELHRAAGTVDTEATVEALWDMVWAGEVSNDSVAPLRHLGPSRTRPSRRPLLRLAPPRAQGRWSLVGDLLQPEASPTERLHALSTVLLRRHGVLTREAALAEGVSGGFASLYPVLRAMEEAGRVRRGYFVDGLGGSQFALPGAVDRLRGMREAADGVLALAAVDPANPYGVTVPWPQRGEGSGRLARAAGAVVVFDGGELRLYLERGGRSLLTFGEVRPEHAAALGRLAARGGKLEIHTADGVPVAESLAAAALRAAGFRASPRGLVLYLEPRQLLRA